MARLQQIRCLPQQLWSVTHMLDHIAEEDRGIAARYAAQTFALEVALVHGNARLPGHVRKPWILLNADDGAFHASGQMRGEIARPAADVQHPLARIEKTGALKHAGMLPHDGGQPVFQGAVQASSSVMRE